jgi:hypothetical protein
LPKRPIRHGRSTSKKRHPVHGSTGKARNATARFSVKQQESVQQLSIKRQESLRQLWELIEVEEPFVRISQRIILQEEQDA